MDVDEEYEVAEGGVEDEAERASADEGRLTAGSSGQPADEGDDVDEEYEEVEIEFDEDDIVSYLVDEEDNEIGFTLLDEDGNEVEYYYVEEADGDEGEGDGTAAGGDDEDSGDETGETTAGGDDDDDSYDLGITREGVAQTTSDINAIYRDGIAVASEFKGAFDDIKSALDFTSILKK